MYAQWIIAACLIIFILAGYAAYLFLKLRYQQKQISLIQQEKRQQAEAKRAEVLDDIRYIAQAMTSNRCELSEGVVRIANLFALISLTEQVYADYPALFQHFEQIKDHPIMDERQALPKQTRMKLDLQRMKSEANLENQILSEALKLANFRLKAKH